QEIGRKTRDGAAWRQLRQLKREGVVKQRHFRSANPLEQFRPSARNRSREYLRHEQPEVFREGRSAAAEQALHPTADSSPQRPFRTALPTRALRHEVLAFPRFEQPPATLMRILRDRDRAIAEGVAQRADNALDARPCATVTRVRDVEEQGCAHALRTWCRL